jgi:hypothetical protein
MNYRINSIFTVVIVVLLTAVIGCQKQPNQMTNTPSQKELYSLGDSTGAKIDTSFATSLAEFTTQINSLGEAHNDFLSEEFTRFSALQQSGNVPQSNTAFDSIARQDVAAYIMSNCNIDAAPFLYLNTSNTYVAGSEAQAIIDSIYAVIDEYGNGSIDITAYSSKLDGLIPNAYAITNYTDRYAAGAAIGIAKFSMNYWDQHFTEWENEFNGGKDGGNSPLMSDRQARVGKADLQGAFKGACEGAAAGSLAGGIGALPGGIIGAGVHGCAGSLKAAFAEAGVTWLDWIPWL